MNDAAREVLSLARLRPAMEAELDRTYRVHRPGEAGTDALLAEAGSRIGAVVTDGHAGLDAATIARLPNLGLVACGSAGFEGIDAAALRARGVPLTTTSVALRDDVADLALLLLLAAWWRLRDLDAWVRGGGWVRDGSFPLGHALRGRRIGLVGMGTIGEAIARRAEPLGLEIGYTARSAKPHLPWRFEPDLLALARGSDILVVIVPGGAATRGLVSREVIEALGAGGCLVNVARGSVVDQDALVEALEAGRLGSAGLDVFAVEPHADPRLAALPRLVMTPHHASATEETRDAMSRNVLDNLAAHFAGRPLLSEV